MLKNKFILTVGLSMFAWLFIFNQVDAKTVLRSGENISISEDQAIEGDFYTAANSVNVSGSVTEDMVAAGAEITINGSVGKDALFISGRTDVHGTVGDDLRIISGEVTLAEPVGGDVFVLGGKLNVLSTATISGDLIIYAGQATIEGLVEGNIIGSVEKLRVDSVVKGEINVAVNELILGDKANIGGNVSYVSESLLVQSLNATVAGNVLRGDPIIPTGNSNLKAIVAPALILLFSALAWQLVSRKTLTLVVERSLGSALRSLITGFVCILLVPLAASLLMISMVGALIGLVLLVAYILILTLGLIAFSVVLGKIIFSSLNKSKEEINLLTIAVGVIGTVLLVILPVLGQLIILFFVIGTFGSIIDLLLRPVLK